MGKKRPERSARRAAARAARDLVHEREKLFGLGPGARIERPIEVATSAVIEIKARATPCPQCEGTLQLVDHQAEPGGVRRVELRCVRCGAPRTLYFRIVPQGN